MGMQNTNEIVSKNLAKYRIASGLTQAELAEKLSYSDKSVSKWERGESLPDLNILIKLATIYNIKLDDFLCEEEKVKAPILSKFHKHKKLYISLLAGGLTWFIATAVFMILNMVSATQHFAWMSFIYAIPVCAIVLLVFSTLWGNEIYNAIFSSFILWRVILSICLSIGWWPKIWLLCVSAGAFELLIIGWFGYRWFVKHKNKKVT